MLQVNVEGLTRLIASQCLAAPVLGHSDGHIALASLAIVPDERLGR